MKIALYGYGKMGKAIEQVALQRGHIVPLKVDHANAGTPPTGCEVAIEFSQPDKALANIRLCLENGVPVVVGTTGWYDHMNEVKSMVADKRGTLLWASNFSIGVNLFFKLNRYLTSIMDPQAGYHARIDEVHHIHKLDAPSGTAITLARDIDLKSQRYTGWKSITHAPSHAEVDHLAEEVTPGPVSIYSERVNEVPGKHSITWTSTEDKITITHDAFSRAGFATGAVVAAEWVKGRKGLYSMEDVLAGA